MTERTQPMFAIGIPARDEELLVGLSLCSVLDAADELNDSGAMRLVIACDSCSDATVAIARGIAAADDRVAVIEGSWRSAGAARAAAVRHALEGLLEVVSASDVWVATTDADTVVPADWLTSQATCWSGGDHAVAGVVDLLEDHEHVRTAFGRHYALGHDSHGHVHGANLGIRADAYAAVGGFPAVAVAEEHALWHALRKAGFICRSSVGLRVATSARLTGRAVGGFADGLRTLIDGADVSDAAVIA